MALSGFTLFKVPKGWQMSIRIEGEEGWSVRIVSDELANNLLARLGGRVQSVLALQAPRFVRTTPVPGGR